MRWIISFSLLTAVLFGCSNGDSSNQSNEEASSSDSTLVLRGLSQDLTLRVPKSLPGLDEASIEYNSSFGQLEVVLGDGFELHISEEQLALRTIKEELLNDMLFTYNFQTENDSELVYQSILPDGAPHSYQFTKARKVGGLSLLIRTASMTQFNQQQLLRMESAVSTLSLLDS